MNPEICQERFMEKEGDNTIVINLAKHKAKIFRRELGRLLNNLEYMNNLAKDLTKSPKDNNNDS